MGNSKSRSSQTSTPISALKVGAVIAGTALLAFGAWSLSSSSDSSENKSQKDGVMDRSGFELHGHKGDDGYHDTASRLIKVMSYNVWSREEVEVIERMEAIGDLIQKHSPDIIFFQEITPYIYAIFCNSQWWKLYECSVPPEKATKNYFCMLKRKCSSSFAGVGFNIWYQSLVEVISRWRRGGGDEFSCLKKTRRRGRCRFGSAKAGGAFGGELSGVCSSGVATDDGRICIGVLEQHNTSQP